MEIKDGRELLGIQSEHWVKQYCGKDGYSFGFFIVLNDLLLLNFVADL